MEALERAPDRAHGCTTSQPRSCRPPAKPRLVTARDRHESRSALSEHSAGPRQPGPDRLRELVSRELFRLFSGFLEHGCELLLQGASVLPSPLFQGGDGFRREIANQDVRHAASNQDFVSRMLSAARRWKHRVPMANPGHYFYGSRRLFICSSIEDPSGRLPAPKSPLAALYGHKESRGGPLLYHLLYMATEKLTVTVQAASIRKLDRWVREGRYANRSQATQAALDLLDRRNALPTLEWALTHPNRSTRAQQDPWNRELHLIDAALDAVEPSLPKE